jgi:hypothetical protein
VNGDGSSVFSGSLSRAAGSNVGSYAVGQNTLSAGSNYTIDYTGANFSITPATLDVTADTLSKNYGAADPTLTYKYSGLANGDSATVFTGALSRAVGSNVGSYAVGQNTLSAGGNYTIDYTGASFSITPATLDVTADAESKVYGSTDPALAYSVGGLVNGDTSSVFNGSLTRAAGETVAGGPHAIGEGSLSAGSNYTIAYTGASFSITPATLDVAADALSKIYGSADPALTYTYSGLVNGDTASVFGGSLSRAAGETVAGGPYLIDQGSLSAGSNYSINYTGADLAVTPATLNVTADALSKIYGSADPLLTYAYSGLVNGDTASVFTGSLSRAPGETVAGGPYAIVLNTLSAGANYAIDFTGAAFVIDLATLDVTANDTSAVSLDVAQPTATFKGFTNGDTASIVSGLEFGLFPVSGNSLEYDIVPFGASAANYAISYFAGLLSLTPPPQNTYTAPVLGTGGYVGQSSFVVTTGSGSQAFSDVATGDVGSDGDTFVFSVGLPGQVGTTGAISVTNYSNGTDPNDRLIPAP